MSDTLLGLDNLDTSFYIIFYAIVLLTGLCIGSFLNVVICRMPQGESLIKGASHCVKCGKKIKSYDLIPLFSWIFLKGRCRSCGERISARYPAVELMNALIYIITFLVMDFNVKSIILCFFFSALIAIAFIDFDTLEINLSLLAFIAVLDILSVLFTNDLTILQRISGAFIISLPFFMIGEISSEIIRVHTGERVRGIELGDTLLMLVSGFLIGNKAIVVAAFSGIILAAIGGLIQKKINGESKFAFAPYLSIGLFIGALWGGRLVDIWMNMFI